MLSHGAATLLVTVVVVADVLVAAATYNQTCTVSSRGIKMEFFSAHNLTCGSRLARTVLTAAVEVETVSTRASATYDI